MQLRHPFPSLVAQGMACLLAAGVLAVAVPAFAQDAGRAAISRGFSTRDTGLVNASLVSTLTNDPSRVQLADSNSKKRLAGVVSSSALLKFLPEQTADVQVILSGTALVLVSDINGGIRAGDKITISPIKGVGMLATSDGQIVGTARTSLNTKEARQQEVTDKDGNRQTIHIDSVPVEIGLAHFVAPTSQFVPPFFQSLANTIAGRPVSLARILLSLVLMVLAFFSISILLYTSVRASMVSLGRNPLAANAIHRGLLNIVFITLLIVAFTLIAMYLILIY
jgi:hypothetical protein